MKVDIRVQGEPDIKPFTKTFHYEESEEFIFFKSVKIIKERVENNMRLNINETLTLFAAYIITSLREGKTTSEIQKYSSKLLSSHQVMIGVPESLREVIFSVTIGNNQKIIPITTPIQIYQYFLCEGNQSI